MEAISLRLEAIALKLEAIASWLEAIALWCIASRLEAIASRFEAIALMLQAIALGLEAILSIQRLFWNPSKSSSLIALPPCHPASAGQDRKLHLIHPVVVACS